LNAQIFLALLVLGFVFLEIGEAWLGYICIFSAAAFGIAIVLRRIFSGTKKTAKALARNVSEEVEKAQGQHPDIGIFEEGLKNAGDLAGKQAYAPDAEKMKPGKMETHRWTFKGMKSVSGGVKKFGDTFKKLMGM